MSSSTALDLPPLARVSHASHCNRCLAGTGLLPLFFSPFSTCFQAYQTLRPMLTRPGRVSPCHFFRTSSVSHRGYASRLAVAFYCIGSLDILGLLEEKTTSTDRESWREWIWEQQTSSFPGLSFQTTSNIKNYHRWTIWLWFQAKPFYDF